MGLPLLCVVLYQPVASLALIAATLGGLPDVRSLESTPSTPKRLPLPCAAPHGLGHPADEVVAVFNIPTRVFELYRLA